MDVLAFIHDNFDQALFLTFEHIQIVFISLVIAMVTGIPAGIFITRNREMAQKVLDAANILMTIPSIAMFGMMLPVLAPLGLGLGKVPAVIALVLALAGVYGVMAYSVAQRRQELGIRMAMGAQNGDVVTMIVRQGTTLAAIGIVLGLGLAFGMNFQQPIQPLDDLHCRPYGRCLEGYVGYAIDLHARGDLDEQARLADLGEVTL